MNIILSLFSYSLEGLAAKADASHESSSVVSDTLSAPSAYRGEVLSGSSLSLTEEKTESNQSKSLASSHEVSLFTDIHYMILTLNLRHDITMCSSVYRTEKRSPLEGLFTPLQDLLLI